jgi:hypothetical protein
LKNLFGVMVKTNCFNPEPKLWYVGIIALICCSYIESCLWNSRWMLIVLKNTKNSITFLVYCSLKNWQIL